MNSRLSHTAKASLVTSAWHFVKPVVPDSLRYSIRNYAQFVHSRKLESNDFLLLSYPKSGSTWLRSMLLLSLTENRVPASDLAKWIPPLHMVGEPRLTTPRIVRSHDSIATPGFNKAGKTLVLIRDPRAVTVSYHYHQVRRNRPSTIDSCTKEMLGQGFDNIGSWQKHAKLAISSKRDSGVMLVLYEDLVNDTQSTFRSILDFYEISISNEKLIEIIHESTLDKLRKNRAISGVEDISSGQSDIRKGRADSWKTECTSESKNMIQQKAINELQQLGYESLS